MIMETLRVLGLDVGEKRIGVAVSDLLGLTAQGIETIRTQGEARDHDRIEALAKEYGARHLVLGLPKNMDGTQGFQAERVRRFAEGLKDRGFMIHWVDERLTTASARRTLIEGDVRREKRKQVIDKLAAVYILQGFIDAGGIKRIANDETKG